MPKSKRWWQSKTKWAGVVLGIAQLLPGVGQAFPAVAGLVAVAGPILNGLGAVLGASGIRDALPGNLTTP